jgi:hypothetical protein
MCERSRSVLREWSGGDQQNREQQVQHMAAVAAARVNKRERGEQCCNITREKNSGN